MAYKILPYSFRKAKELGVVIKPSSNLLKKIDVFKNGNKIASIGATGYGDYPTFMKTVGKEEADKHRVNYKRRHEKDRHVPNSPGFYADKILW